MLVKCIDGREYHVLVKEKEVLIMDDSANLSSISLFARQFRPIGAILETSLLY